MHSDIEIELFDNYHPCTVDYDFIKGYEGVFRGGFDSMFQTVPDEYFINSVMHRGEDVTSLLHFPNIRDHIIEQIEAIHESTGN